MVKILKFNLLKTDLSSPLNIKLTIIGVLQIVIFEVNRILHIQN